MEPAHFRWCNFWVPMSYSLPLNLKTPTDVYFDIPLKKSAPLLLFQTQERFQKFLPRFFNIKKMDDIIFFNLESTLILILEIFYFLWEVFLINFLSKMKSQMAWKGFGVISKWSFYSLFGSPLILCVVVAWCTSQCTPYEFCRNLRPYNSFSIYQAFFLGHPQAGSKAGNAFREESSVEKNKVFFCWTFFAVVPFHFGDIFCSKVYLLLYILK